jgi:hypothetical protein
MLIHVSVPVTGVSAKAAIGNVVIHVSVPVMGISASAAIGNGTVRIEKPDTQPPRE